MKNVFNKLIIALAVAIVPTQLISSKNEIQPKAESVNIQVSIPNTTLNSVSVDYRFTMESALTLQYVSLDDNTGIEIMTTTPDQLTIDGDYEFGSFDTINATNEDGTSYYLNSGETFTDWTINVHTINDAGDVNEHTEIIDDFKTDETIQPKINSTSISKNENGDVVIDWDVTTNDYDIESIIISNSKDDSIYWIGTSADAVGQFVISKAFFRTGDSISINVEYNFVQKYSDIFADNYNYSYTEELKIFTDLSFTDYLAIGADLALLLITLIMLISIIITFVSLKRVKKKKQKQIDIFVK